MDCASSTRAAVVGGKKGNRTNGAYGNFQSLWHWVLPPSPNRISKCYIQCLFNIISFYSQTSMAQIPLGP